MGGDRKNKVDERTALAIGAASGLACALSGAHPTGSGFVDVVMLFVAGFTVAWAGASASWWVIGAAAIVSVVVSQDLLAGFLGLLAFGLAVHVGLKKANLPELRAAGAALVVNALARSDLQGFLGLSAIVAVVVGLFVVVMGVQRRPGRIRATVEVSATIVGVAAIVAIVGFAVAAGMARAPLLEGNKLSKQGLSAVNRGEFEEAAEYFESATRAFDRADEQLSKPWGQMARAVPGVAQHYAAASDLSAAAGEATSSIVSAVREIDLDGLTIANGRVNLEAVSALQSPFTRLSGALASLDQAVSGADSQWLVPIVRDELHDLSDDLAANDARLDNAMGAVALAPQLLGADGERNYLVLFTTPAEARGLGGFPGNYAVLRVSDGKMKLADFGRVSDLALNIDGDTELTGPPELIDRYKDYVLTPDGDVAKYAWPNITMPPDFPTVAQAAANLFPQTGGRPVDGVAVIDPYVIQALLKYTGPISIDGFDQRLTAQNAADMLLKEQYLIADKADRVDFLESAAQQTMQRILGGSLPSPVVIARDLGPLALQGRLLLWTTDADERDLLSRTHLLGEFPTFDGGDGIGVEVTNLGANKIDTYLQRDLDYVSTFETSTGRTRSTLTFTLTNTAPPSGLPEYVIGNRLDLPDGTNRLRLCVHTPLLLDDMEIDGDVDRGMEPGTEYGMNVYCRPVTVAPQSDVTLTMRFFGELADTKSEPVIWEQPLASTLVIAGE